MNISNISELLKQPRQMNAGCAAPFLEGFATELASVGHTSLTINEYLTSAIHFGGWLEAKGVTFADTNEETIRKFGMHRCKCPGGRTHKGVSRAYTARVQRFANYLRQQGAVKALANSTTETPALLVAFRDWLLRHRGLATITVERHEHLIMRMLPSLSAPIPPLIARRRCEVSFWIRYVTVGPLMPRQSSERCASICDFLQPTEHVTLVSTICCRPWRSGSSPRYRSISIPTM